MASNFSPRDWQDRFVRDYQTQLKKNFLVEACTSAGKTGGSLYAYNALREQLGLQFLVAVVPGEHLKRQYALDAKTLFDLNLSYGGTDRRLKRMPTPVELLRAGYDGIVVSYQWLTNSDNAESLRNSLRNTIAGKAFVVLDEVHHASSDLSFGKACERAFPDDAVAYRLMTSGTPFRSDNNRILGNWITYQPIQGQQNTWECIPDFRYTLAEALNEENIPVFSFVTVDGEFTYRRGEARYEGLTFEGARNEQELTDALNTAIHVQGDWIKTAIEWAHERMKRDRRRGLPECATYVRVSRVRDAYQLKERILHLTGEDALVVVSQDEDTGPNASASQGSSQAIEQFAKETGVTARSWIIGVGMLGEGVSIHRLKYRIHATNVRAPLAFMQDLGRLLRKFPAEEPEPVETLIPAHPSLISLALGVMNEVAHVIRERDEDTPREPQTDEEGDASESSFLFEPIASTGEIGAHIVEGETITDAYTRVAEWAIVHKPMFQQWQKTPGHLAQMFQEEPELFETLRVQYETTTGASIKLHFSPPRQIPDAFPSEYADWLPDEKEKYARQQVQKKVNQLAYQLKGSDNNDHQETVKAIHTKAKRRNSLPLNGFIGHEGWERIYAWLCEKIANSNRIDSLEDL